MHSTLQIITISTLTAERRLACFWLRHSQRLPPRKRPLSTAAARPTLSCRILGHSRRGWCGNASARPCPCYPNKTVDREVQEAKTREIDARLVMLRHSGIESLCFPCPNMNVCISPAHSPCEGALNLECPAPPIRGPEDVYILVQEQPQ